MSTLLTVEQVAERIGCHPQAIRRLCASGRLPASKLVGRWRIDADDVQAWILAQRVVPPPSTHSELPVLHRRFAWQ